MSALPPYGFHRWDLVPESDESGHGFYGRMVLYEGETNISYFNFLNGLSETTLDPGEMLAFLLRYPFPDTVKAYLRRSTIIIPKKVALGKGRLNDVAHLRGEILGREDITTAHERWCPACLAEKPYRRLWWDVLAIVRCPYHQLPILQRTPNRGYTSWYETGFGQDSDESLIRVPRKFERGNFAHYILGRLQCEEALAVPFLDDAELGHAIDACKMIGMLVSRPFRTGPQSNPTEAETESGFRIIRGGTEELLVALVRWMEEQVPFSLWPTLKDVFTWAYSQSFNQCGEVLGAWLRTVMSRALAVRRSLHPRVRKQGDRLTISIIVDRVGLPREPLIKFLRIEGFLPARDRFLMHEDEMPAIEAALARTADLGETARMLGLPRQALKLFYAKGFLKPFNGRLYGRKGPHFRLEEIEGLLQRLRSTPLVAGLPARPFIREAKRRGLAPQGLAIKILDNEIRVVAVTDPDAGFSGLTIETIQPDRTKVERAPRQTEFITTAAIRNITCMRKDTIRALVANGHLVGHIEENGMVVARRGDVERFARGYMPGRLLQHVLRVSSVKLAGTIRDQGFVPIIRFAESRSVNTVYRCEDVVKAFGLAQDYFQPDDPALNHFWETVLSRLSVEIPAAYATRYFNKLVCWVGTPYLPRTVQFEYRSTARSLCATIVAGNENRAFVFLIDEFEGSSELDELFSAMQIELTRQRQANVDEARKYKRSARTAKH